MMDSLQFYDDHLDENKEAEEESHQLQPDFSVNEVEIEEVCVVVETQELEVEEVVTFENNITHDEENDLLHVEDRGANPDSNVLDGVQEKGEEEPAQDPIIVLEAEEGPQVSIPVDQVRELVDLNRETFATDLNSTDSGGDELMAKQNEAPSEADTKAMEAADEDTAMLQQTEDGVANGNREVDLNASDMEADDHLSEPATEPAAAVSDGGLAGKDSLQVPADSAENEAIINEDANEKQTEGSEHVGTEAIDANEKQTEGSEHAVSGRKVTNSNLEDVNNSDDGSVQAGDSSASQEIPSSANVGLGSAFVREQLFNDANLAQLKAQILVMGILRKGSKPSDDLLKSACPTSFEGTPGGATVAEDVDNAALEARAPGDPSSSRKRKFLNNEAVPCDKEGMATELMMAVKDNLHLSQSQDASLLDDTDRQLRSAQISAHDAMATATSALAQSHLAWAQIRCEDHSASGIAREQQIASVAATVAAAASVAKAAVEAAKAIANVSIKAFMEAGQIANGQSSDKGKNKSVSTRNRRSDMLASVVKAAGMAAEAATQAGSVLAFANPLIPAGPMEGHWTRKLGEANEAVVQATRAVKRKTTKASPKTKATIKKSKGNVTTSRKTSTPRKVAKGGSNSEKKNGVSKRSKTTQKDNNRQPTSPTKSTVSLGDLVEARDGGPYINEKSECIAKGSVVEIMTEEEGLRGGWFSGKVLRVTKGQAHVVYDELLDDDGSSKVKEWFPFKASGDPAGPRRQVRPVHPYSSIREAGSKKRRRVAMGSQNWAIGDRVDGFIQDVWWEGVLVELNDIDESKATVYFPGENDTQILKVWDLRPSLQWEDGNWGPWANPAREDEPGKTQQKVGSSSSKAKDKPVKDNVVPKVTDKAKEAPKKTQDISPKAAKAKKSPKKAVVDEPPPSRSTRQSNNVQEVSAKAPKVPKVKKSAKNVEVPVSEVDERTPSRSTRKRKGPELSVNVNKKEKKNPRAVEDPVDVQPTSTRSTRSSPQGTMITTKDTTGGKMSTNKLSDKKSNRGKKTGKESQKDTIMLGAPKKLDLNVSTTVTTVKIAKKSVSSKMATTTTSGKLKAEEIRKRPRRR